MLFFIQFRPASDVLVCCLSPMPCQSTTGTGVSPAPTAPASPARIPQLTHGTQLTHPKPRKTTSWPTAALLSELTDQTQQDPSLHVCQLLDWTSPSSAAASRSASPARVSNNRFLCFVHEEGATWDLMTIQTQIKLTYFLCRASK